MGRVVTVILLSLSSFLFAHGVQHQVLKAIGVGLRVQYDTGEPMAGARVAIYTPGNEEEPYLEMTTNSRGEFMFLPDKKGLWVIVVSDTTGHALRKEIPITDGTSHDDIPSGHHLSWLQKIAMAVCVIWGCIGTALFYLRKEKA